MFRTSLTSPSSRWMNSVLVDADVAGRRNCVDYRGTHMNQSQLPWRWRQQFQPKHRNKLYLQGVINQKSSRRTTPAAKPWYLTQELNCFHSSFPCVKYGKYLLENLTLRFNTRTCWIRTSPYVVTPVTEENVKYYCVMHDRKSWKLSKVFSYRQELFLLSAAIKRLEAAY
jgi:hypothetical protein